LEHVRAADICWTWGSIRKSEAGTTKFRLRVQIANHVLNQIPLDFSQPALIFLRHVTLSNMDNQKFQGKKKINGRIMDLRNNIFCKERMNKTRVEDKQEKICIQKQERGRETVQTTQTCRSIEKNEAKKRDTVYFDM